MEQHPQFEKFSPNDAEYLTDRESSKSALEGEHHIFGESLLFTFAHYRRLTELTNSGHNLKDSLEEYKGLMSRKGQKLRQQIIEMLNTRRGRSKVFTLFKEAVENPRVASLLESNASAESLEQRWKEGQISDELLEAVLSAHTENFKHRSEELERILPWKTAAVRNILLDGARKKIIPVSQKRVNATFKSVTIRIKDALTAELDEQSGSYSSGSSSIFIAEQLPDADTTHTLLHEYIHALSGKTAIKVTYPDLPEEYDLDEAQYV